MTHHSRIVVGFDKIDPLLAAVKEVIVRSDECAGDDCGANLIRDILIPAWRDYEIGEPTPEVKG